MHHSHVPGGEGGETWPSLKYHPPAPNHREHLLITDHQRMGPSNVRAPEVAETRVTGVWSSPQLSQCNALPRCTAAQSRSVPNVALSSPHEVVSQRGGGGQGGGAGAPLAHACSSTRPDDGGPRTLHQRSRPQCQWNTPCAAIPRGQGPAARGHGGGGGRACLEEVPNVRLGQLQWAPQRGLRGGLVKGLQAQDQPVSQQLLHGGEARVPTPFLPTPKRARPPLCDAGDAGTHSNMQEPKSRPL